MKEGERQVAPTLDGIRRDHVARYEWLAQTIPGKCSIVDIACGIGYGSNILAKAGHEVVGMDIDADAIAYARKHYAHPRARFAQQDGAQPGELGKFDVAVSLETIEHIEDPRPLLKALRASAQRLIASVPNEAEYPYGAGVAYHFRHYTAGQFEALLNECGWGVTGWYGQEGPESEVEHYNLKHARMGRTIMAVCEHIEPVTADLLGEAKSKKTKPKHVAILGLGPSLDQYTNICKRLGGRHKYADETWCINSLGSIIACDRIFHMDDVRIQELRAAERPESNIAAMLEWMKTITIPVTTSRPHPDYPALEPFPLVEVLNDFRYGYFNSTAAYAVAYAIWLGVEKISLFGCDYTYPDAHDAEKGRACVEFWLGMAAERGIRITVPKNTTLLDALHTQRERFYGYDTLDLHIRQDEQGRIGIEFSERADLPSAEQVEAAYDHDKHPNPLMVEAKEES